MKLLNRNSMPVWMLADSMLAVCSLGAVLLAGLIVPTPGASHWIAHSANLTEQLKDSQEKAARSQQQLAAQQDQFDKQLNVLNEKNAALVKYQEEASAWIKWAEPEIQKLQSRDRNELKLRQELLNLRGDFSRVMFVIDISGSMGTKPQKEMARSNWGSDGQPWTYVRNQVTSWLKSLPVDSFRIICFNHETVEFPAKDAQWISGDNARLQASEFLQKISPKGGTNTEKALQIALAWKPTAIILFTDGAPTRENGEIDRQQQATILNRLRSQTSKIPVNVIAVSNYYDENLSSFLHGISSLSGGGFVGL